MRFRLHRGGLSESMATLVVMEATLEKLVEYLSTLSPFDVPPVNSIQVDPYSGPDKRIGWDATFIVIVNGHPIGFTDEMPL